MLLIGAAAACGDDVADPIVRVAQAPTGIGGRGDGDVGDLCAPCGSRSDCEPTESCVQLTRGSDRFCTRECGGANPRCPQDYLCSDVPNVLSFECVPQAGDCAHVVF